MKEVFISLALFTIVIFALTALLFNRPESRLINSETKMYEITHVDPPKHVYVDLKDVESGHIHSRVHVSKHFNNWREKLIAGRKLKLTRENRMRGDHDYVEWKDLRLLLEGPVSMKPNQSTE